MGWEPIGQGLFTSSPAAIASDNGALVHVMARGTDGNLWRNFTTGFNTPFQAHWQALSPAGSPVAAPAMAIHGVKQYIAAIGSDFTLYVNHSTDAGGSWAGFSQIGPNPGLFI